MCVESAGVASFYMSQVPKDIYCNDLKTSFASYCAEFSLLVLDPEDSETAMCMLCVSLMSVVCPAYSVHVQ